MKFSIFFHAVDEIAARFTRLLGIGAALGILSASETNVWEEVLRRFGFSAVGLDSLLRSAAIIILMFFAFLQGLGVSALIGEKIGYVVVGSRGLARLCSVLIAVPVIIVSSIAISEVNGFAMSVLDK